MNIKLTRSVNRNQNVLMLNLVVVETEAFGHT
jgi:hypothetical protein